MGQTVKDLAKTYLNATLYKAGVDQTAVAETDKKVEEIEGQAAKQIDGERHYIHQHIEQLNQEKEQFSSLLAKTSDPNQKKELEYRIFHLDQEIAHEKARSNELLAKRDVAGKTAFEDALWTECAKNGEILKKLEGMGVTGKNYHGTIRNAIFTLEKKYDQVSSTIALNSEPQQLAKDFLKATFDADTFGINFTDQDKIVHIHERLDLLQKAWEATPPEERSKQSPKKIFEQVLWSAASFDESPDSREIRLKYKKLGIDGPQDAYKIPAAVLKSEKLSPKVKDDLTAWWDPKEEKPLGQYVADANGVDSWLHGIRKEWVDDVVVWGHKAIDKVDPYVTKHPVTCGVALTAAGTGLYFGGKGLVAAAPAVAAFASKFPKVLSAAQLVFGGLTAYHTGKTGADTIDGATTDDPTKSSKLLEKSGGEAPVRLVELALLGLPFLKAKAEPFPLVKKKPGLVTEELPPVEASVTIPETEATVAEVSVTSPGFETPPVEGSLPALEGSVTKPGASLGLAAKVRFKHAPYTSEGLQIVQKKFNGQMDALAKSSLALAQKIDMMTEKTLRLAHDLIDRGHLKQAQQIIEGGIQFLKKVGEVPGASAYVEGPLQEFEALAAQVKMPQNFPKGLKSFEGIIPAVAAE